MDLQFKGKTVIVTGGAGGIGGGISEVFAQEGANVIIADCSAGDRAETLAKTLSDQYGTKVFAVQCDISSEADVARAFDFALDKTGTIDILVNNAGLTGKITDDMIYDLSVEKLQKNLSVNIIGTVLMSREFARRQIAAGKGGRVVNILSKASVSTTTPGHGCLAITKAGLMGLTKQMAVDLTEKGIIVNGVMPGTVINSKFKGNMNYDEMDEKTKKRLDRLPLKRFAKPIEIGKVVAFLCSEQCQVMVGSIVDITAGLLL